MTDKPNQAPRILPTVGRVVHFHLGGVNSADLHFATAANDTYAAIVAYVHSATMVNLTVSDANGVPFGKTSVPLVQGDDERPLGSWCEWMAYQKGQAAKTEQLESDLDAVRRMASAGEPLIDIRKEYP